MAVEVALSVVRVDSVVVAMGDSVLVATAVDAVSEGGGVGVGSGAGSGGIGVNSGADSGGGDGWVVCEVCPHSPAVETTAPPVSKRTQ